MLNTPVLQPVEQRRRAQRAPLSLLAFLLFLTVFVTAQVWIARRLDDSATERLVPVSLTAPCAPFRLPMVMGHTADPFRVISSRRIRPGIRGRRLEAQNCRAAATTGERKLHPPVVGTTRAVLARALALSYVCL